MADLLSPLAWWMSGPTGALLASPYGAPVLAVLSLAAVAAGAGLGASYDHLNAALRREVAARLALLLATEPQGLDPFDDAAGVGRLLTAAAAAPHSHRKPKGGMSR